MSPAEERERLGDIRIGFFCVSAEKHADSIAMAGSRWAYQGVPGCNRQRISQGVRSYDRALGLAYLCDSIQEARIPAQCSTVQHSTAVSVEAKDTRHDG